MLVSTLNNAVPLVLFIALLWLLFALGKKQCSLNKRIFLGLLLGIGFGFGLQSFSATPAASFNWVDQAFDLVGSGYLSLLKMLVIPLVLTSIVHAILNLGDVVGQMLKALASRAVLLLLIMTSLASAIGIGVGVWFEVGQGLALSQENIVPAHAYQGLVDTLLNMLPVNPVNVMSKGNTVAVVIFAVLLGLSGLALYRLDRPKVEAFKQFFSSSFQVVRELARFVINLTPYGVLALMAQITANQGLDSLLALLNYVGAMYVAIILVIAMHLIILLLNGHSPWSYLKRAYKPLLVGFSTRSSFGTLPVTEETLHKELHTRQVTASFVPSLGATLGMNACAGIFPAMLVVMAMTILQEPITWQLVVMVMFINAVASLGISGIPGTALVAATVTLTALDLPYAVVGLVQGVDPVVDMGRTATNINGVMTTAVVVDKSLNSLKTN